MEVERNFAHGLECERSLRWDGLGDFCLFFSKDSEEGGGL